MKHDLKITLFLLGLFFSAQIVGLFIISKSISNIQVVDGEFQVNYVDVPTGRPETQGWGSFTYLLISIFIGTLLVLLLIRFKMFKVWRIWFLLAVGATLGISLSVFIDWTAAFIIGFALGYLKIFKPNVFVHNFTEIFMYSGIAVLLVPIFDVLRMIVALFAISLYDAYAVWQSKHMIKMAEFQSSSKLFAGLHIPYEKPKKATKVKIKIDLPQSISQDGEARSAILGGGDIAFPLLFAGSVMIELIKSGLSKEIAFFQTLPIPLFAGIALFLLFVKSQKGKFYPAMPFITAGCLIGYGIVLLL